MSILLLLALFTILLVLGFGFNGWTLAALILGLTIGLSFLMVSVDIEEIKKNWRERRCDLDILVTSFLYKPSSDARSTGEFIKENFSFCMNQSIQEILKVMMAPLFSAFGTQLNLANTLQEVFNAIRTMKSAMMESFMKLLRPMYQRFIHTGMAFSQNFQRFYSAMRRVAGIAVSSLYLGLSFVTSMQNFFDFVIQVVLIIMAIIAAMFIWSFWLFVPFVGLLIATVNVLEEGGVDTGGWGSLFCFDPATSVELKNGTVKPIDRLIVGDILEDGAAVEGILRVKASQEQMYSVGGILVSGSHLLWSEELEDWIPVHESSFAKRSFQRPSHLVCLRTSTRNIVLRDTTKKVHIFRDWEELPLNLPEADSLWNYLVTKLLHSTDSSSTSIPTADPLCGPRCLVMLSTGEKLPISMVQIGMTVYSEQGFTKVLGVYEGETPLDGTRSVSNGTWIQQGSSWSHPTELQATQQRGFHLVTQTGTFWVQSENHSGFIRDFTEVGLDNLPLTYSYTRALLKKSLSKEELCEPVSLSQAFLSYSQPIF